MDFFNSSKSILENIGDLCSPLILITVSIAIYQLRISLKNLKQTRENAVISSKRDAIKLAIEQAKFVHEKILPLEVEMMNFRKDKGFKMEFYYEISKFTKDELVSFGKEKLDNYVKVSNFKDQDFMVKMITIAQYLNTVAVHFNSKVADDDTGFSSFGEYYCYVVYAYYPIIASVRKNENDLKYKDIKILFNHWSKKVKSHKVSLDMAELENQKEAFETESIKPLGT